MSGDEGIAAWLDACRRLAALGDRIGDPAFPGDPRSRAEGVRHLATQAVAWLSWAVGHADLDHPTFFRQNDLVVRWGGPNVDQTTRRARLDPAGVYRITGEMHSCEDFVLTVKNGDMHMERYGILTETTAAELGIAEGDRFTIVLGGDDPGDGTPWLALHPDASMVNLREYYWDWRPLEPAAVAIERLDTIGQGSRPLDAATIAAQLDDAVTIAEHSLDYWNRWVEDRRSEVGVNAIGEFAGTAGGSRSIAYAFGFFRLEPGEALLLEAVAPDAAFWDLQLYTLGWFESPDFVNHQTSLNHTQAVLDGDGVLRVVIAAEDPGVANWLDTEGRREGMVTFRWIRPRRAPEPGSATVRLVRSAEIEALLPVARRVDERERRAAVAARQAHLAWRYRT